MPADTSFVLHELRRGQRLALVGRLDVSVAADLRLALASAVEHGDGELVLDLSGVSGLDATGLGVLVGAHRRAGRAGRTLVLERVPPTVARILLVTRLDKVVRSRGTAACA